MAAEAAKPLHENDDDFVVLVVSVPKRVAGLLGQACRTLEETTDDFVGDAIELAVDRLAGRPTRQEVEQLATLMGCDPDELAKVVLS